MYNIIYCSYHTVNISFAGNKLCNACLRFTLYFLKHEFVSCFYTLCKFYLNVFSGKNNHDIFCEFDKAYLFLLTVTK